MDTRARPDRSGKYHLHRGSNPGPYKRTCITTSSECSLRMVCEKPKYVGACNILTWFSMCNNFNRVTLHCFQQLMYKLVHKLECNKKKSCFLKVK